MPHDYDRLEQYVPDHEHQESRDLFEGLLRGEIKPLPDARWMWLAGAPDPSASGAVLRQALMLDTKTGARVEMHAYGDEEEMTIITAAYIEAGQSRQEADGLSHSFGIEPDGKVVGYLPGNMLWADNTVQEAAKERAELIRSTITGAIRTLGR